jgi:D-alanine transaminase
MSRYAYVNGRYLPFRDAKVHVEDRGYQFADAVYEVCEVRAGGLVDERRHLDRLERSLDGIRLRLPMSRAALGVVLREVVARNRIRFGMVYLQIGRGVARRDLAFPVPEAAPSVVVTARPLDRARLDVLAASGIAVVSMPDNRWGRVDIKSVSLLPNALARQAAIEQGAREAWFIDASGDVTEGASANAWIVTADGKLVTRRADHAILGGITRSVLFEAVEAHGLIVEERPFALEEAYAAREAFITSATQNVMPVIRIDGRSIGDGKPGPLATVLRRDFHRFTEIG